MTSKIHNYDYTSKELKRFLVALTYKCDKLIRDKGEDPDKLRATFYEISEKDKTKSIYDTNIYLDTDIEGSSEGIDFIYCVHSPNVFIINYNPNIIIGQVNGQDIFGQINCLDLKEVEDSFAESRSMTWEYHNFSNNLIDIFNMSPSIIRDLCNHDDIGPRKLLEIMKIME